VFICLRNLGFLTASTSNRLLSVTEAAGVSAETWDAESGSFTYDPNGNLLTAPAPYALSAVTYDPRNLPLSLTRGGVTTTYRYDAGGQRITKQVGGGATEVYILDGATTLGVVTLTAGGTPTAWHFNVLAGDRVIGRQPHTGARRHYHTDLLGSTRAVVAGTTVLESTDYDPWGLALPGRTLGAGTKEGFTGKERDAETGLDYFGARSYLPALGRWGSVDPLAELYPAWSPYNYVLNDPNRLTDPDGRCPKGAAVGSICLDFFIAAQSAGGYGGDGRRFDAEAPPERSRAQVVISPDRTPKMYVSHSSSVDGDPVKPSSRNGAIVRTHRDGSFTVTVRAMNSAVEEDIPRVGHGLIPAINAKITFSRAANGSLSMRGSRDAFPSLGIYDMQESGWRTLPGGERKESNFLFLFPILPNDRWSQPE
jgi:RHS repeat-associated protein